MTDADIDEAEIIFINDKNNAVAIYKKGAEYGEKGDTKNMITYCEIAVYYGVVDAMTYLAHHYAGHYDTDNMIKYNKMAVDKDDAYAMQQLGHYYYSENDYENMFKYFNMAIEHHRDISSMDGLADYYKTIEQFDEMLKYCQMILDNTSDNADAKCADKQLIYRRFALRNMAIYYKTCKKYDEMFKYYDILIKNGDTNTLVDIAAYYKMMSDTESMIEYYVKAIYAGHIRGINGLGQYYTDNKLKSDGLKMFIKLQHDKKIADNMTGVIQNYIVYYFGDKTAFDNFFDEYNELLDSLKQKSDYIDELEVMPEGPKYKEAKDRFNKNVDVLTDTCSGIDAECTDE